MLKKYELKKRSYYLGSCRNTNIAMWDGEKFIFINYFFDKPYVDTIVHFDDVKFDSYDGFMPIKEISIVYEEIKNVRIEQDYKNGARKIYKDLKIRDLTNEIWKSIPNYEGLYYISNYGRVKKHDGNFIMKQNFIREYLVIGLTGYDHNKKTHRIHRLVAQTFKPSNDETKIIVNHINGIKTDNRADNLEWVTHQENSQKIYLDNISTKKLTPMMVVEIKRELYNRKLTQTELAKKYGVSKSTISEIKTGKKWKKI